MTSSFVDTPIQREGLLLITWASEVWFACVACDSLGRLCWQEWFRFATRDMRPCTWVAMLNQDRLPTAQLFRWVTPFHSTISSPPTASQLKRGHFFVACVASGCWFITSYERPCYKRNPFAKHQSCYWRAILNRCVSNYIFAVNIIDPLHLALSYQFLGFALWNSYHVQRGVGTRLETKMDPCNIRIRCESLCHLYICLIFHHR